MVNQSKIIGFNTIVKNFKFNIGDILEIKYEIREGYWRIKTFRGRCISKKKKGINTKIILRTVIDNVCVEYDFFLYGSDVVGIKKVGVGIHFNVNRAKLYFLRRHNINKSKV